MSGIRTQPPKVTASILPQKEPTMQEKDDSDNEFNRTIVSYKAIAMQSVTTQLSEVSQILSKCQMLVSPFNNIDEVLPLCSDILSKMEQFVQTTAAKQSQVSDSILSCSSLSSSSSDSVELSVGDLFVSSMSSFIDRVAPNSTFNKRKAKKLRRKRVLMRVPRELRAIWQNCDKIFCQAPGPGHKQRTRPRPSNERKPLIDFSKVNIRMLRNLPQPQMYPVSSCSQDPKFYQSKDWYSSKYPFGSEYGYMTQLGVVPVSSEPVHGYVFDIKFGSWILHASYHKSEEDSVKLQTRYQSRFQSNKLRGATIKFKRPRGAERRQHPHHYKSSNG